MNGNIIRQNWIWLDPERYPDSQTTVYYGWCDKKPEDYAVAEFKKRYVFPEDIVCAHLVFSGDTEFRLYANGDFVASGPPCAGGDFQIDETKPWPEHYAFETEIRPDGNELEFFALVKLMPVRINEFSKGRGGFMLYGSVELADGSVENIGTDATWLCRRNRAFTAPDCYDGSQPKDKYAPAVEVENIWRSEIAPIPPRTERETERRTFTVDAGASRELDFEFPLIYSGFIRLSVKTEGTLKLCVQCRETDEIQACEYFTFAGDDEYTGLQIRSIGGYRVTAENRGDSKAEIALSIIETHFPVEYCAHTTTSDEELNLVLRVCEHSLKSCMQTAESESVLHCEPMACTGDYYVEMLMTAMSYGDLRLAEFDVLRTARILRAKNGEMFHVTYSMIWILMLRDAYLFTGRKELLRSCRKSLLLLLEAFDTYTDETGLVDDPPSYMFVDWVIVDGISLHHPPKALGQTFLNMFYYGGLTAAVEIFGALGDAGNAEKYRTRAEKVREAINGRLFDRKRGLYFEGLNTPTRAERLYHYMPQNVDKRYFRKHSNVLAALFGVYEGDRADLLRRTLNDDSLGYFQPYFGHFVLEAVRVTGLTRDFTLRLLDDWKAPIRECPKGLPEGFYIQEDYPFDHSHGWGGAPLYALPTALSGLEILEPGMKRIKLHPDLLSLRSATVEIPTPYGTVRIAMEEGKVPDITLPDGIVREDF